MPTILITGASSGIGLEAWTMTNQGAVGPLTDQSPYSDYYEDAELMQESARVVREAIKM